MFDNLAKGYQAVVAIVTSPYTRGSALVGGGGVVGYWPDALGWYGGIAIAAMGVYVLIKSVVESAKKA